MRFAFTPAAQRALIAAAGWTSCKDSAALDVPEVLLGLVDEPECRSALVLARYQVDALAVRARFPRLAPGGSAARAEHFSAEWLACLDAVEHLLIEYPRPLELATEHLLLGLTATDNEVARWLFELGLSRDALEAEVHRLSGHEPGPLPLDDAPALPLANPKRQHGSAVPHTNPKRQRGPSPSRPAASGRARQPEPAVPPPLAIDAHAAAQQRSGTLRILDAAANRANEGLRVIEDYLRFVLDDGHLTGLCKEIRHALADALRPFPTAARHAARDTQADVGTAIALAAEQVRADARAVAGANFSRVEQSLRSLEEYAKIESPEAAAALEALRYRVYTLERAASLTHSGRARLAEARLYVLIDGQRSVDAFANLVGALVEAGTSLIQLRDKQLADRELVARARLLRRLTRGTRTLFIMNDRPDLALVAGADGVHVGQEELETKDVRRVVGDVLLVGVSTHSLEQARAAVLDGADYIGVGPTFPSGTKQFAAFTGVELLRAVQAEIRLPAFAIGGITLENLPQVLAAGFARVAVGGAVTGAADPATAARQLLLALES